MDTEYACAILKIVAVTVLQCVTAWCNVFRVMPYQDGARLNCNRTTAELPEQ